MVILPDIGQYLILRVQDGPHRGTYYSRLQNIRNDSLVLELQGHAQIHSLKVLQEGLKVYVHFTDIDKVPCSFAVNVVKPILQLIRSNCLLHPDLIQHRFVKIKGGSL